MKISQKATYGVIAALDLADSNGAAPVQSKAIARRQGIPLRFLEQVLHAMKKAGLVDSQRGARGGYLLGKPPREISLAEIVEALDGPILTLQGRGAGRRRGRERADLELLLADIREQVRQAELGVLHAVTLTDLLLRQRQLQQGRTLMYHI